MKVLMRDMKRFLKNCLSFKCLKNSFWDGLFEFVPKSEALAIEDLMKDLQNLIDQSLNSSIVMNSRFEFKMLECLEWTISTCSEI